MRTRPVDWERVLSVNLTGAFNCAKAAARHLLKAKGSGRIVNISSVVGERGNTGQAAYSASKAALIWCLVILVITTASISGFYLYGKNLKKSNLNISTQQTTELE